MRAVTPGFITYYYPSPTKLWQGNIFTSVCQEFCPRGEVCLSACWDTPPPPAEPSWPDTPSGQTPPGQTPSPPPPQADTPQADTPQADTPQQMATTADGTHPTGMHSCLARFF